jgi:hypothetical protein
MTLIRVVFAVCLSQFASSYAAPSIEKILPPTLCGDARKDPIVAIDSFIENYRKETKETAAFQKRLETLIAEEIRSGEDSSDLNWIRAADPWLLPSDFPTRPGFIRCAAELQNFRDTRLDSAIADWKRCIGSLYPKGLPPEFESLRKCLTATKHVPAPEPKKRK